MLILSNITGFRCFHLCHYAFNFYLLKFIINTLPGLHTNTNPLPISSSIPSLPNEIVLSTHPPEGSNTSKPRLEVNNFNLL